MKDDRAETPPGEALPPLAPGLYAELVTEAVAELIARLETDDAWSVDREPLDEADAHLALARHLRRLVVRVLQGIPSADRPQAQVRLANALIDWLRETDPRQLSGADDRIALPGSVLRAVESRPPGWTASKASSPRPVIPIDASDLLVNARGEPRVGTALAGEIPSADRIDLLCAFVKWNGIRVLLEPLTRYLETGRRLRLITTTYIGATERRALDRLAELGAEIRVSYETRNTRLHAKAWLFHRETGFSTAYVGSSNLSRPALLDGLEWNVRLSAVDTPELLEKFAATFESYWLDASFEAYQPERDRERFERAIRVARGTSAGEGDPVSLVHLDVRPYPHQREILDRLAFLRQRRDRHRNLVVAATGTGKTVVAALDYRRMVRESGRRPNLLFVAHRKEILLQSLSTFRTVLRDGSFGELYVDGHRPEEGRHVFASVQSLDRVDAAELPPEHFEVVIVDEIHHAAAATYRRLLDRLQPRELLGLTATPERADGQDIIDRFGRRFAVELRLWEAIDRGLLSPFQYFGHHDDIDLSGLQWTRGGYAVAELEGLYTGNDARLRLILQALEDRVRDPRQMRALGFCVSIAHAEYMAERFRAAKIPAMAVSANSPPDERDKALARLRDGEVNILFAVDLFNEGVDVPAIDTVLFLRPTESATIFLQQLGRGLRLHPDKDCLTVLDFIGNANRRFRFDLRYRALAGGSRSELRRQIEDGFPVLPAGCSMHLDRVSSQVVLQNLKQSIGSSFASLVEELRALARDPAHGDAIALADFLRLSDLGLEDLYRAPSWSWTRLRRAADLPWPEARSGEDRLLRGLRRCTHIDDPEWLATLGRVLGADEPPAAAALPAREQRILHGTLNALWGRGGGRPERLPQALRALWDRPAVRAELRELLSVLDGRADHLTYPLEKEIGWTHPVPLAVHAHYSLEEVLAACGVSTFAQALRLQAGVLWVESLATDLLFVTLQKSEKHYSPSTMYRDYAISADRFHWESQSVTRAASETGQRYVHHRARGSHVLLFVREHKRQGGRTLPYTFLGPADYESHREEQPMQIVWRLHRPMPADEQQQARVVGG